MASRRGDLSAIGILGFSATASFHQAIFQSGAHGLAGQPGPKVPTNFVSLHLLEPVAVLAVEHHNDRTLADVLTLDPVVRADIRHLFSQLYQPLAMLLAVFALADPKLRIHNIVTHQSAPTR